jgi:hypothetical protein
MLKSPDQVKDDRQRAMTFCLMIVVLVLAGLLVLVLMERYL